MEKDMEQKKKEQSKKGNRPQVNFRVSLEELKEIDKRAEMYHVTRSEYVKRCAVSSSPDDRAGRAAMRAVEAADSARMRATVAAIMSAIAAACSVVALLR